MEVVACRTCKINTVFTAAVAVLVPKYIYGQYLCEQANAGKEMWKVVACRTCKINTVAVAVLVPKYIYGQYLCEQANAGKAMWKLWRVGLAK